MPHVVKKTCSGDTADLADKEWPRDKIVRLIELYRDIPALYDMTAPGYSRRHKKEEAYKRFSKHLGISGFDPDPEGKEFSPEFKREFFIEYFKEKKRLDGEPEEYDEKILSQYLALVERVEIGYTYFWHMTAPTIALAPDRHGDDKKFFLRLGIARLQYYYKHKEPHMLSIDIPE